MLLRSTYIRLECTQLKQQTIRGVDEQSDCRRWQPHTAGLCLQVKPKETKCLDLCPSIQTVQELQAYSVCHFHLASPKKKVSQTEDKAVEIEPGLSYQIQNLTLGWLLFLCACKKLYHQYIITAKPFSHTKEPLKTVYSHYTNYHKTPLSPC